MTFHEVIVSLSRKLVNLMVNFVFKAILLKYCYIEHSRNVVTVVNLQKTTHII